MIRPPHRLPRPALFVAACAACATATGLDASTVGLQNATATYSQDFSGGGTFLIDQAIDTSLGGNNGWAILEPPPSGSSESPHAVAQTAAFETTADTGYAQGTRLTVNLYHLLGGGSLHELGRFRISVTTDDRNDFADGLNTGGDVTANWTALYAQTAVDTGTANPATPIYLDPLADASIRAYTLVDGDNDGMVNDYVGSEGNNDPTIYTLTFHTNLTNITGLRLEALPDPLLSSQGPGTTPNGNFVLTELTLDAEALLPEIGAADTLNFGNVRVGTSATTNLTLTNTGELESVLLGSITGLTETSDDTTPGFSATLGANDPYAIVTGDTEDRTFRFTPLTRGAATDELTLTTDHAGDANVTLNATGVGPEFSSDAPEAEPIDLGQAAVNGTTGTDLAVGNTTTDLGLPDSLTGLTLLGYQITGDNADLFSLTGFTPNTVLSAGDLTDLHLLLTADETLGVKTATLTLFTDQGAALGQAGDSFSFDLTAEVVTVIPTPSSALCLAALMLTRRRRERP